MSTSHAAWRPWGRTRALVAALGIVWGISAVGGCSVEDETRVDEGVEVQAEGTAADVRLHYGDDAVENGRITFSAYCASCHGTEGAGDGPVAPALKTALGDLRSLAQENGGTFPTDSVYATIDGREDVAAHGSREMPVWGNVWIEQSGRPVRADEVDRRINELVEYLRTIQDTTAAAP